jgi:hypothetical protein
MSSRRDQAQKHDSPYNYALRIIKDVAARGATELKLSDMRLTSLPWVSPTAAHRVPT